LRETLNYLFNESKSITAAFDYRRTMDYSAFIKLLKVDPDLVPLLKKVRPKLKTAIATNRSDTMDRLLTEFGLTEYFDLVVTSLDVYNPKPHPESVNKILSYFDITPEEACYIGDSDVDRETSERAGVLFVAYRNEELKAAHHVSHFDELIPILKRYGQM